MKYRVISTEDQCSFEKEVTQALSEGYTLQGGVSVSHRRDDFDGIVTTYSQAVVWDKGTL